MWVPKAVAFVPCVALSGWTANSVSSFGVALSRLTAGVFAALSVLTAALCPRE